LGDAIKGEEVKWIEWQKYFQAVGFLSKISEDPIRDTLRGLEHFRPQFQEWSEWRTRSACRFPLDLKMGVAMPLPHLIVFSRAARIFTVQMRAHLALGDSAAAYADFQEGFQAYRALEKEPTLTCGLGRALTLTILFSQVGHGLRERTWAESELKKIEADLASIRVWEDYRLGMASERGSCNGMMDQLANASSVKRAQMIGVWGGVGPGNMNGSTALSTLMWTLIQKRVFRDNQLRQNQHFDELLARLDSADTRLDLDRAIPSGPEKLANAFDRYYYFFLRITGSIYSKVEQRYLALKTQLEETRLASALERFRIAHGAYPETLSELVPDFLPRLPQDPYADAPLIYRRVEGGTFLLYSVGRNRVDDGGKIDPQKPEKGQADAVWLYAPPP
jgi:hypothetical protein